MSCVRVRFSVVMWIFGVVRNRNVSLLVLVVGRVIFGVGTVAVLGRVMVVVLILVLALAWGVFFWVVIIMLWWLWLFRVRLL